ncbi:MAG: response regulator [Spirochaetia bacterium]|jgi:CheY-like chemotaxis protein|nr:response regulator [Spirochaetia bacterium]
MHALIADDDELNRTILRRMLARNGWTVDEVTDGQAAVEACRHTNYDIVLLDIRMPGISGHQAASLISGNHESRPAPKTHRPWLVAVTGADRKAKDDFAYFDAYLQKPFMLAELTACLDSLSSAGKS